MELSQKLKQLRENNGYTQQQVADALNIERSTYTYYETGKTTPDINNIAKLAKIFKVSYSELLEDEDSQKVEPLHDSDEDLYQYYDSKNFNHIYELSKKEKTLISLYRVSSEKTQNYIVDFLKKEVEVNQNKKNNFSNSEL